ncbi:MAG TPA: DUF2339 domain-containing protein, partial [Candidatus Acidoferrales bacterium]|nr:DUF2339 domain-containing protein [Candidatus Acidoferrales bacterium]
MELMILLAIGTPLLAVIWLITRAINDRDQIEELTRRIDNLDQELRRIQSSAGAEAKAKTTEESLTEKVAGFMPASPPARKVAETILPAPASAAVIPPVAARVPPLLPPRPSAPLAPNEPNLPAWPVGPRADTPVARSTPELESPAIPPPPIIPPLSESGRLAAESASEPAEAEPVLPTARVAAVPEAGVPEIALEKTSFEMRFGKYWAVRIGVVIVLTGCAFLAKLAYHNFIPKLGAAERISLLYLASGLLLGAGAWWQRHSVRESLKNYGQVLFAGGLAAVYFTTF